MPAARRAPVAWYLFRVKAALLVLALATACSSPESGRGSATGGSGGASDASLGDGAWLGGSGGADAAPDGASEDASSDADAGTAAPALLQIHDQHRFVPNAMFGGWGPHLGHLVRAAASSGSGSSLWFVDDACAQSGAAGVACDVLHNHTLAYFEKTTSGWQFRGNVALPADIQQNTATIASANGTELSTFGVDVQNHLLRECRYAPATGPKGCSALPFTLSPNSNYIGAAIAPNGSRLVWWTTVVDGGGGSFHWVVDYGGGWNGPRSGGVGGYNDASYVNISFGGDSPGRFTMHGQLVSGLAPSWGFVGAVGTGDLTTTDAVVWATPFGAATDAVVSTNDVWTDPVSGDTHLVARTEAGAAALYFRPKGGSWASAPFLLPATYRARFVFSKDRLVLIYGPNAGGLAWRIADASARKAGSAVDWGSLAEHTLALPGDFGAAVAIYPESPAYQLAPPAGIHVALVGATKQNLVLHAAIEQ